VTSSGTMRALGAEVSEHARQLREKIEQALAPMVEERVAAEVVRVLTDPTLRLDLPTTLAEQAARRIAKGVAAGLSLEHHEGARKAILDGLWAAIKALMLHRPPAGR
jgi:hypothetical protein